MIRAILVLGMVGAAVASPNASREMARAGEAVLGYDGVSGPAYAPATPAADTVTLHVEGMTCAGCVLGVRKVLTKLDGVSKAEVTYETKRAVVTFDASRVTVEQMIAAIKTLGYTARVVSG